MRTFFASCAPRCSSRRRPGRPGMGVLMPILAVATLVACDAADAPPDVAAAVDPEPISGRYEVRGVTRPLAGPDGQERRIAGMVILKQDGDAYTATFKLDTTFPGAADPVQADVIGKGEGTIEGRTLRGTTETQLVVSTVPGVDTDFAFVPRIVGARIESTAVTEIAADGSVVIELENRPAEGETDYMPTRTRLTGRRTGDTTATPRPEGGSSG